MCRQVPPGFRSSNGRGRVTDQELEAAFTALFESGEADKIMTRLMYKFSGLPRADVRDMFQEACLEVVRRQRAGRDTSKVAGLVQTIARNKLVDLAVARSHLKEGPGDFDQLPLQSGWRHDEDYQAKIERATKYIRDIVESWPVDNHRRTMLLILDAAVDGLLLQPKEMDEVLGCARGTSGVWKERALDRLRAQLATEGLLTWTELLELLPIDEKGPADDRTEDDESIDE